MPQGKIEVLLREDGVEGVYRFLVRFGREPQIDLVDLVDLVDVIDLVDLVDLVDFLPLRCVRVADVHAITLSVGGALLRTFSDHSASRRLK